MVPTVTITNFMPFAMMLLGGGVGLSLFTHIVKKICARFGWKPGQFIHTLVVLTSLAMAGLQYLLLLHGMPKEVVGLSWISIYGFSQVAYNLAKQANTFLNTYSAGKAALAGTTAPAAAALAPATPTDTPAPVESQPAEQSSATEFSE